MSTITNKPVQIHFECICGHNIIDTEYLAIKWKDLSKWGVKRKKDRKTGEPFFFQKHFSKICIGHED